MTGRHGFARLRAIAPLALALSIVAGPTACRREGAGFVGDQAPPDAIAIDQGRLTIRTGTVGTGPWARPATSVLAIARNTADEDLIVTLRGALVDGQARHELAPESLRIPAGGERVFALVDAARQARPGATTAEVRVSGALRVGYPPSVTVSEGKIYRDQGRAVAKAYVTNTNDRKLTIMVHGAFFDEGGAPLERPFFALELAAGGKRGVELVGPPGSVSGQLFIGEVQ